MNLHFIDENWELKKKILSFRQLASQNSSWDPFLAFKHMLLYWKISKNLCSISIQNTKEDDQVAYLKLWLTNEYALPFRGKLLHVGCFAHILDLFIEDEFQKVPQVLRHEPKKKSAGREAVSVMMSTETCRLILNKPKDVSFICFISY